MKYGLQIFGLSLALMSQLAMAGDLQKGGEFRAKVEKARKLCYVQQTSAYIGCEGSATEILLDDPTTSPLEIARQLCDDTDSRFPGQFDSIYSINACLVEAKHQYPRYIREFDRVLKVCQDELDGIEQILRSKSSMLVTESDMLIRDPWDLNYTKCTRALNNIGTERRDVSLSLPAAGFSGDVRTNGAALKAQESGALSDGVTDAPVSASGI